MRRRELFKAFVSLLMLSGLCTAEVISYPGRQTSDFLLKALILSDIHITSNELTGVYPEKVIAAMNAEGGDVALVIGDLVPTPDAELFSRAKKILDGFKMPYELVIGNHDCQFDGEKEEVLFKESFSQDNLNRHIVVNGIHLIGLDSGCGKKFVNHSVCSQNLQWLEKEIELIPSGAPMVMFTHYPYAPESKGRPQNADQVLALLKQRRLLAVVSGHVHRNTEQWNDGVLFTTSPCASTSRPNTGANQAKGYRILTIGKNLQAETKFTEVPGGELLPQYETSATNTLKK